MQTLLLGAQLQKLAPSPGQPLLLQEMGPQTKDPPSLRLPDPGGGVRQPPKASEGQNAQALERLLGALQVTGKQLVQTRRGGLLDLTQHQTDQVHCESKMLKSA